ncbi:translation initiation factor IF-3 [Candidatus Babeliales bacterium]|nr:translation initiation factor IF-3 [Candidatus Babeliales bacterium]
MKRKSGRGRQREKALPNAGYLVNEAIRADALRVITHTGDNLGEVSREQALQAARDAGLDLVLISGESDGAATAKIMDFGRFLYDKKKQTVEAKKKQKTIEIKEVKFRPNIDIGDYTVKLNRARNFLLDGKHVKITLQFRGREIGMKYAIGAKLFDRISGDLRTDETITSLEEQKESKGTNIWSKILVAKLR